MKFLLFSICLLVATFCGAAQDVLIHAHNDYQQPEPLTNALRNKAFSIEADVYLSGSDLLVAHDKKELPVARTLSAMYLQPIIAMYKQNHGKVSPDRKYAPILMIDIKENGAAVIAQLVKLIAPYRSVFDCSRNRMGVKVVLSGDRGPAAAWVSYPPYIFFDGRPYEVYDSLILKRIGFISDSYLNYINPKDSISSRLRQLVTKVHGMGKLLRLWATPDDPASWSRQRELDIDIINTDKVAECRRYFSPTEIKE